MDRHRDPRAGRLRGALPDPRGEACMSTAEPEPAMHDDSAPTPIDPLQRRAMGTRSIALMSDTQSLAPAQLEARRLIHREYAESGMTDAFREVRTRLLELSDRSEERRVGKECVSM